MFSKKYHLNSMKTSWLAGFHNFASYGSFFISKVFCAGDLNHFSLISIKHSLETLLLLCVINHAWWLDWLYSLNVASLYRENFNEFEETNKNCLLDSLPDVCARRFSRLNEIHPIQAWLTDRINAQTFLNYDLFFSNDDSILTL